MSYHSSALPIEVATISRVMLFSALVCGVLDTSAGADTVMGYSSPSERPLQLAHIPEQAGHDAERLLRHRQKNVLIGRVLRTARIGVRHPHGRQFEDIGEDIVRQRAAEIRQHGRRLARGLS